MVNISSKPVVGNAYVTDHQTVLTNVDNVVYDLVVVAEFFCTVCIERNADTG